MWRSFNVINLTKTTCLNFLCKSHSVVTFRHSVKLAFLEESCQNRRIYNIVLACVLTSVCASSSYAGQIEFDAWKKCALERANNESRSADSTRDAHRALGQCASYQFNYMQSLSQEGSNAHQVFTLEREAEEKIISDIVAGAKTPR